MHPSECSDGMQLASCGPDRRMLEVFRIDHSSRRIKLYAILE